MKRGRAQIPAWRYAAVVCTLSLTPVAIDAADDPARQSDAPVPRCQVAVVNPVSGFAECVKPRGVPVAAPPPHPAPRPEECRRHADLDLKSCPDGIGSQGSSE